MHDDADAQTEGLVDGAHGVCVTRGQVVVDRDHVDRHAGQRRSASGQRRGQRLPLSGLHLRDQPVQQNPSPHQLAVEMAHSEGPAGHLSHQGKAARHCLLAEAGTAELGAKLAGNRAQLCVVHACQRRRVSCHALDQIGPPHTPSSGRAHQRAGEAMRDAVEQARVLGLLLGVGGGAGRAGKS